MKITAKTTKAELKSFLGANAKAIKSKDKGLFDRIAYASKVSKEDDSKVKRTDLIALAKEVIKTLGDAVVEAMDISVPALATAENSVKKLAKGVSKKQEIEPKEDEDTEEVVESDETATDDTEEKAVEPKKKSAKKSVGAKKKEAPKKDGVTVLDDTKNPKAVQLAKMFPQTIEVGDAKYELASDIKTMEDLYNALGNDEEIVFAYYWTKRHLRQFPYYNGWLGQPKSFDNDLDLATAIYVSDEKKVSYQVSMYTEAVYAILPTDFDEEDGVRIAGGIEYQIYRAV